MDWKPSERPSCRIPVRRLQDFLAKLWFLPDLLKAYSPDGLCLNRLLAAWLVLHLTVEKSLEAKEAGPVKNDIAGDQPGFRHKLPSQNIQNNETAL